MKKALISPLENNRILQFAAVAFDVAPPLFWVDCADDITTENHKFNGVQFEALSVAELKALGAGRVLAELAVIDAASVRAIREYIAGKADAPQILKDKENAAILARAKL